jgi:hypothetical protein
MSDSVVRKKLGNFISSVFDDLHGKVAMVALEGHDGSRVDVEGKVHSLDLDAPYVMTHKGEVYGVGTAYAFIEFPVP